MAALILRVMQGGWVEEFQRDWEVEMAQLGHRGAQHVSFLDWVMMSRGADAKSRNIREGAGRSSGAWGHPVEMPEAEMSLWPGKRAGRMS